MIKLKIISDGSIEGTRVENAETGELLGGVLSISFNAHVDEIVPEVTLTLCNVAYEITPKEAMVSIEDIPENYFTMIGSNQMFHANDFKVGRTGPE